MPNETFTLKVLSSSGLQKFLNLQSDAVKIVSERFYTTHGALYERFGARGRQFCCDDIAFHLEFLRPILEFGLLQPMVDYLRWLSSIFIAKSIPIEHLTLSLDWLSDFFAEQMGKEDGFVVTTALLAAKTAYLNTNKDPILPLQSPIPFPEAASFENALLAGNSLEALTVANQLINSGRSLTEVEMHVIQPVLYSIGEKWQANQVSVAQEHMATAIAHSVMTAMLLLSTPPALINRKILLACVEDNLHEVGLRMVADAFLMAGWEIEYLGANVPGTAIVQQVIHWKPDLVGLSVSFAHQLPAVKSVIAQLNDQLGNTRPAVIVGGLAINRFNKLAAIIGSDGTSSNAVEAVTHANLIIEMRCNK